MLGMFPEHLVIWLHMKMYNGVHERGMEGISQRTEKVK